MLGAVIETAATIIRPAIMRARNLFLDILVREPVPRPMVGRLVVSTTFSSVI